MAGSLLTAQQVAELLGVPASWVYEQSRAGRIPTVTLGRYRRYRREAIEAWVEEIEATGLFQPVLEANPTFGRGAGRAVHDGTPRSA